MTLRIETFDEQRHGHFIVSLTALLHESYRPLAEMGFRYSATHQDERATLKRLKQGESFLAFWEDQLAGTIYLRPPKQDHPCEYYQKHGVFHFGQFAVRVDLQGKGLAREMLAFVEGRAKALGGVEIALDTAEGATALIATYTRHGYRKVGSVKWTTTNYQSVIMSKVL
jgi:GNAT superfamily N-acetyltransferase